LLGSAMVDVTAGAGTGRRTLLFSGDVGRAGTPLHPDPEPPGEAEFIVVESTYGDRTHPPGDALASMTPVLRRMLERRAILLVPAFAVGRAQQMIYCARRLVLDGVLPPFPIYVDSPMAVDATAIYGKYPELHDLEARELAAEGRVLGGPQVHFARTVEESKRINRVEGPAMILSASGMLSGGRVLHHLRRLLPDARHMIALVGYQAAGTRGRALQAGAAVISIHKQEVPVRAEIVDLGNLSGHADRDELQRWFASVSRPPRAVFVTHGEPPAADALAAQLRATRGWRVHVPRLGEAFDLEAAPGGTA
jgi:metallo-beta-lactamase family protein